MIDEKKIEEAAEDIYEEYFSGNYDYTISEEDHSPLFEGANVIHAVKLGAQWAQKEFIKSLWHDAAEEPEEGKKCIGHYKCTSLDAITFELPIAYNTWNEYVRYSTLKKWCYADDIIPKKGGEE